MKNHSNQKIAGLSFVGGRKDNYFLSIFEFIESSQQWKLTNLNEYKDEDVLDHDNVITDWIHRFNLEKVIVNFPQNMPLCNSCDLECPGVSHCPQEEVAKIKKLIDSYLISDRNIQLTNPKKYEQDRAEKLKDYTKSNLTEKESNVYIMSKSFKRRLKKGYLPYWNRPIDFWVWLHYYDLLLEYFKSSFDSFGNVSLMLLQKFQYIKKHLPESVEFFESNVQVSLIELFLNGIITKKDLVDYRTLEYSILARINIIKACEKHFNLFIYEEDIEAIVKSPRAFESFLLALSGVKLLESKCKKVSLMGIEINDQFIVPDFSTSAETI